MKYPYIRVASSLLAGMAVLLMIHSCDYNAESVDAANHQLIFPNEGETLIQGTDYKIEWEDLHSTTMRIRLMHSGVVYLKITESAPNTGEYVWTIPDTLKAVYNYTVKVLSNEDDFTYFESNTPFKILKISDTASFVDPRDGQVYRTVRLSGRWWMARNFNYDTAGSYCYGNDPGNCATGGRFYTIQAALSLSPPGWHLPTDDEWRILESYLGIPNAEINSTGFRGVNAGSLLKGESGVGFHARLSGYLYTRYSLRFSSINQSVYFWTSSYDPGDSRYWVRQLTSTSEGIERTKTSTLNYSFSVRYIRDLD